MLEYMEFQKYFGLSRKKNISTSEVIAKALRTKELYSLLPNHHQLGVAEAYQTTLWNPHPYGVIKVNVDAAVTSSVDHFRVGVVGKDNYSAIMCVEDKYLTGSFSLLMAELFGIQHGISRAMSMG